jgi:hypothetical protein
VLSVVGDGTRLLAEVRVSGIYPDSVCELSRFFIVRLFE